MGPKKPKPEYVDKRTKKRYTVVTRQLKSFNHGDVVEERGNGYYLVTDKKNHCISLPKAMVENTRWFEPIRGLSEQVSLLKMLLDEIEASRKGSIGSIDNVYLPQLSVKSVKEAREALNIIINKI